ncbi:hypothetical protein V1525DRAFT_316962, partial [Lipomyces kononenkoae]
YFVHCRSGANPSQHDYSPSSQAPIVVEIVCDKSSVPASLVYESYEEIHACSCKEMLDYCKSIDQPRLFRYFWTNWYRPSCGNFGSRWEVASLRGRPGSSAAIPISRTT